MVLNPLKFGSCVLWLPPCPWLLHKSCCHCSDSYLGSSCHYCISFWPGLHPPCPSQTCPLSIHGNIVILWKCKSNPAPPPLFKTLEHCPVKYRIKHLVRPPWWTVPLPPLSALQFIPHKCLPTYSSLKASTPSLTPGQSFLTFAWLVSSCPLRSILDKKLGFL